MTVHLSAHAGQSIIERFGHVIWRTIEGDAIARDVSQTPDKIDLPLITGSK
jgi:hypothetical protein